MGGADLTWAISALWQALKEGQDERALRIQAPLASLVALMQTLDGYITLGKMLLLKQGIFQNRRVRGPVGFHLDSVIEGALDSHLDLLRQACA